MAAEPGRTGTPSIGANRIVRVNWVGNGRAVSVGNMERNN